MNVTPDLAAWLTVFSALFAPVCGATDTNNRQLPRLYSFYSDDGSCSEHTGEKTQTVIWNGRPWNLTALESLASPPSETKRTGTPLDIRPLSEFVMQAQKLGALPVNGGGRATPADTPVGLRLVMVTHDLLADEPARFSLQTIIAVRLCDSSEKSSASALYIGPPGGVNLTEWWRSSKSQRWIDGYREAFSLSVADALKWAAGEVNVMRSPSAQ